MNCVMSSPFFTTSKGDITITVEKCGDLRTNTGFIENKLYLDKVFSYVFNDEERKNIRRHTLYTKEDNNKKYYMIYDIRLSNNEDSVYVFYDPYTKESRRAGDLVNFLIENKMHVLESSSLNNKIDDLVDDDDVNEISVKNVSIK